MKHISKLAAALALVAALALGLALAGCDSTGTDATPATTSSSAPAHHKTHHKAKPHYTTSQRMAIASAKNYLEMGGFSKKGLLDQLASKYGEGFSKKDAKFAVNHVDANWNQEAVEAAKNYLETQPMSRARLVQQLESPYGDKFTHAQAVHGAKVAYEQR